MSALLNVTSRPITVTRVLPPFVVLLKGGSVAWIEHGIGFLCHVGASQWVPLVDAEGVGGQVMTAAEVAAFVATHGRPS